MRPLLLTLLLLCVTAHFATAVDDDPDKPNTLTAKEAAEGWLLLFDGETTFGWHAPNGSGWNIARGMLAPRAEKPGLLVTTSKFPACELKFQYIVKTPDPLALPMFDDPRHPRIEFGCGSDGGRVASKGYHIHLPDGGGIGRALLSNRDRTAHSGWITLDATVNEVGRDLAVKWNYKGSGLDGSGNCRLEANGADGHFALLGNGVLYRNIKLRPLEMTSVFNGKDLTGWKVVRPSQPSVTEQGDLRLRGASELKTEGQWKDFILQLECKSNGRGSIGVRGSDEVVIHNQWQGDDRKRPVGDGTGGIKGGQAAREVVADDGEWFTLTIINHDEHLAVWVNGYQTADYSTKQAGERGPIRLRGHDATSYLRFRNIRLVELPGTAE